MAGHSNCAKDILRSHFHKEGGCPGGCVSCISRYKNHPAAIPSQAKTFMEDPAAALRYIGHSKNERRKKQKQTR
jgi:hypothetical protein